MFLAVAKFRTLTLSIKLILILFNGIEELDKAQMYQHLVKIRISLVKIAVYKVGFSKDAVWGLLLAMQPGSEQWDVFKSWLIPVGLQNCILWHVQYFVDQLLTLYSPPLSLYVLVLSLVYHPGQQHCLVSIYHGTLSWYQCWAVRCQYQSLPDLCITHLKASSRSTPLIKSKCALVSNAWPCLT